MPTTRHKPFAVDRPAQLRALASPLRQEIVDAITAAGPSSIAEVAALLGRPADRLYFHFKHLVRAGLLVRDGRRKEGRAVAALFDVPGRPVRLQYDPDDPDIIDGVKGVFDGVLRLARRDFKRALESGSSRVTGPRRDTWVGRGKGWLTDAQIEQVNEAIVSVLKLVHTSRPREGTRPVAFTFVLAPEQQASPPHQSGPPPRGPARSNT